MTRDLHNSLFVTLHPKELMDEFWNGKHINIVFLYIMIGSLQKVKRVDVRTIQEENSLRLVEIDETSSRSIFVEVYISISLLFKICLDSLFTIIYTLTIMAVNY